MRRLQLLLAHVLLDRSPDTKLLPHSFGDMDNAEIKTILDVDIANTGRNIDGRQSASVIQNPSDAMDQALQRRLVQLIGSAEAVHHLGLDIALLGMADILGKSIIADGRAVLVAPLGRPEIHAHWIACTSYEKYTIPPIRVPT